MTRTLIAALLICVSLLFGVAHASDTPIARILAVESDNGSDVTARIKVVAGAFYKDHLIEVFTPKVKAKAVLTLPKYVDMLMKGDEVTVTFKFKGGSVKISEGFVAEAAKVAKYEDGQKILAAAGSERPSDKAGASLSAAPASGAPPNPACPYSAADLKKALGLTFGEAQRNETPFPGGREISCMYAEASPGFTTLSISFTIMAAKDFAASTSKLDQIATGKTTPIVGDPDGARWKLDQYVENRIGFIYDRGSTTRTTINMWGGSFKAKDAQSKLLKLKRAP